MNKETIKNRLLEEAEKDYKKFSSALIPNIDNVLGVRLPILRKIAKEIYQSDFWQEFVNDKNAEYMEETMLKGMIIGQIKATPKEILKYIKDFIPKIDNWSVCDSFCAGLKFTNKNLDLIWNFIQPYFKSKKEYYLRFVYVMCLDYFVKEEFIDKIFEKINEFSDERYYSKMAVAWLVSVCCVKFPQKTFDYLKTSNLDDWTFNKSIRKCIESYRITDEMKNNLKKLLR